MKLNIVTLTCNLGKFMLETDSSLYGLVCMQANSYACVDSLHNVYVFDKDGIGRCLSKKDSKEYIELLDVGILHEIDESEFFIRSLEGKLLFVTNNSLNITLTQTQLSKYIRKNIKVGINNLSFTPII